MMHPKKLSLVESPYSITWIDNGILHQEIKPEIKKITFDIAKVLVRDRTALLAKTDCRGLVIVTVNNAIQVDKKARDYYKLDEPYAGLSAIAMIMDNYIAKMIGNLVFLFKGQKVPTKLFNNKEQATNWLKAL